MMKWHWYVINGVTEERCSSTGEDHDRDRVSMYLGGKDRHVKRFNTTVAKHLEEIQYWTPYGTAGNYN